MRRAPARPRMQLMLDLEPGRYAAVCFIPIGGGEDGAPHFTGGMVAELEVTS